MYMQKIILFFIHFHECGKFELDYLLCGTVLSSLDEVRETGWTPCGIQPFKFISSTVCTGEPLNDISAVRFSLRLTSGRGRLLNRKGSRRLPEKPNDSIKLHHKRKAELSYSPERATQYLRKTQAITHRDTSTRNTYGRPNSFLPWAALTNMPTLPTLPTVAPCQAFEQEHRLQASSNLCDLNDLALPLRQPLLVTIHRQAKGALHTNAPI